MTSSIDRTATRIGVEKSILIVPSNLGSFFHDVIEVGLEDEILVLFPDTESETTLLVGQWAPGEGMGLAVGDNVFPDDGDAAEDVEEAVVVGEGEGDGGGVGGTREGEAVAGDGGGGAEVELGGVVEFVGVDAVDLGDFVEAVGGEPVEEALEEFQGGEPELRWQDCVEEALAEGPYSHY